MAIHRTESVPFNTRRPFSRADARAAGISVTELLGPRFHRIVYDRYVAASVPITSRLVARTALELSPPGSYVSHYTAAELWGGLVPDHSEVHVTVPGTDGRTRRRGIKAHSAPGAHAPATFDGLRLTTPIQTFLDLAAAGLALVDLVVLGDSLVKARRLTAVELTAAADACLGHGARRARRAARFVRDGVDSPQESRLRMLLVLAGLPEPEVNHIIRNLDGSWRMRFDLYYRSARLLVEYDGRQHAEDSVQWRRDLARREELDAAGYRIIVVTKADLFEDPEALLDRVRDALAERGATGVRRRYRNEWRHHFGPR